MVFSVTPFKIVKKKKTKKQNQNRSIDKVQNLGNAEEVNMQRPLPRFRSEEYFIYEISEEMFYPNFGDLYGDTMLVPIRMGTNMADGNQQKHLLPSFGTKA